MRSMKIANIIVLIIGFVLLGLIGCDTPQSQSQQPTGEPLPADLELAATVQEVLQADKRIDESTTVILNQSVSVGVKVSGFDRFRLKQIRQEVHTRTKELIPPDHHVYVTSDKRLFAELQKIEKRIKDAGGIGSPAIQEEIKKINKDMQG